MQHSFIYHHRIVTIHMRRLGEQWMSSQQLEGTLLGEGRHTGTAERALHEASQSACRKIDENLERAVDVPGIPREGALRQQA
ncbi:hypothetical protein [Polaromonas sp. YR568]|uniref:hypothetical protein n=1 Tax=Polaromonas sp. YR568 TaxID=1855301 RepID=UPI00398BDEE6